MKPFIVVIACIILLILAIHTERGMHSNEAISMHSMQYKSDTNYKINAEAFLPDESLVVKYLY